MPVDKLAQWVRDSPVFGGSGVRPPRGVEKRKVPLSYKRPRSTSQYKTRKIYNRGTDFFSQIKKPSQDHSCEIFAIAI